MKVTKKNLKYHIFFVNIPRVKGTFVKHIYLYPFIKTTFCKIIINVYDVTNKYLKIQL